MITSQPYYNYIKMQEAKKVYFHTLGCKLNFSESSTLARQFEEGGFRRTMRSSEADICVINSCTVTEHADKKCRNLIRRIHRENPSAIIAVTGCFAQLSPAEAASVKGVDIVLGNNEKVSLYERVTQLTGKSLTPIVHSCSAEEITTFFAACSSGDRTRSFLKVQDGCDYKCAYCAIHYARGHSRNIPIGEIVAQARDIAAKGVKEIVITGVNTGDFGRTTGERFIDLLSELDKIEGIERYRISSIEPNLLTDEIIELCAKSEKFQPHFHIPLQSGSDRILGLMRRRYTTAKFAERIARVREAMPEAFIGIDVIVGFPGEGEEEFEESYRFLSSIAPAYLHVFPFSERENTPALTMPNKVRESIKRERATRLGELCERLHSDFCGRFVGRRARVLVENTIKNGVMFGYTENYVKVRMAANRALAGQIVEVELGEMVDNCELVGTIID